MSDSRHSSSLLQETLDSFRRSIRRAVWFSGLGHVLAVGLSGVTLAGLLDVWWHWETVQARVLVTGVVMASVLLVLWRRIVRPSLVRMTDDQLAMLLERAVPAGRGLLAAAVQFDREHAAARLGSPELQTLVIRDAEQVAAAIDARRLIDHSRLILWLMLATGSLASAAGLTFWQPRTAEVALTRFLQPTRPHPWPQVDQLVLLDWQLRPVDTSQSLRIASDSSLRFFVRNQSRRLPADARAELELADGQLLQRALQMVVNVNDRGEQQVLGELNLGTVREPFRLRVLGGDDESMAWLDVNVLVPPELTEVSVTVDPPEYTGLESRELTDGGREVTALAGSRLAIRGRASTPLRELTVNVRGRSLEKVRLQSDGLQFSAAFVLAEPGQWPVEFLLVDREQIRPAQPPSLLITALQDLPPDVRLISPAGDLLVTPRARVPIAVSVEDDLKIDSAELELQVEGVPVREPLPFRSSEDQGWQELKTTLEIARFNLEPGQSLTVSAMATDAGSHLPERPSRSVVRRLDVVSSEQKLEELETREDQVRLDLVRLAGQQDSVEPALEELLIQLQATGRLRAADRDGLRFVSQQVEQLRRQLAAHDGLRAEIDMLLSEVRDNDLAGSEVASRLAQLQAQISGLMSDHLLPLQQTLFDVERLDEQLQLETRDIPADRVLLEHPGSRELLRQMQLARMHQRSVRHILRQLTAGLEQSVTVRDLQHELQRIRGSHDALQLECQRVLQDTIALPASELTAQTRAELSQLSVRQRRLGEALTEWARKLRQFHQELDGEQRAALRLDLALETFRRSGPDRRMGVIADAIERNRAGEVLRGQQEIADELLELQSLLASELTSDAETRADGLRQIDRQLAELMDQIAVLESTAEADRAERLRAVQDRLRLLATRLGSLRAPAAAQATLDGSRMTAQAWQAILEGREQSVSGLLKGAVGTLAMARTALQSTLHEAESEVLGGLLKTLLKEVRGSISRQQQLSRETEQLETNLAETQRWTRTRLRELNSLIDEQNRLESEVRAMGNRVSVLPAIQTLLGSSAAAMSAAAGLLRERRVDPAVRTHQTRAVTELQLLTEHLILLPDDTASGQEVEGPQGAGDHQLRSETAREQMQLRLLLGWQTQVASRTRELSLVTESERSLTDLEALSERQQRIRDAFSALAFRGAAAEQLTQVAALRQGLESLCLQLQARELGEPVQSQQSRIIEQLQSLIRSVGPSAAAGNGATTEPGSRTPSPAQIEPPERTEPATGTDQPAAGGSEAGRPGVATTDPSASDVLSIRRQMVIGVWGHLPPDVQAQILNVSGDRSLPQYSREISNYYESLNRPAEVATPQSGGVVPPSPDAEQD